MWKLKSIKNGTSKIVKTNNIYRQLLKFFSDFTVVSGSGLLLYTSVFICMSNTHI